MLTLPTRTIEPDELRDLITAVLRDDADPHLLVWLKTNPDIWYEGLVALKRDLETQLNNRAARMLTRQQECLEMGSYGKDTWFREEAEHQEWRRRAVGFKFHVEEYIPYAKRLLKDKNLQATHNLNGHIEELEERIELIERELGLN